MPYDICEDETTLSFIENEMAKKGVTQDLIDITRAETETKMLKDLIALAKEEGDLEFRFILFYYYLGVYFLEMSLPPLSFKIIFSHEAR